MPDKFTILQELKQLLRQHFPDIIKDVILFGSQATETACSDSDYDILIVLKKRADWKQKKAIILHSVLCQPALETVPPES